MLEDHSPVLASKLQVKDAENLDFHSRSDLCFFFFEASTGECRLT